MVIREATTSYSPTAHFRKTPMNVPPFLLTLWNPLQPLLADLTSLAIRLTIGQAFMQTGWGKLHNLDNVTKFFASLGIPAPQLQAAFVGGLELVGGALLIVGLVVRPIAVLLLGTMAVAILTADRDGFLAALAINPEKNLTDVVPWMFGLLLLALLTWGPGRLSLDALLWNGKKPAPGKPKAG